MNNYLQLPLGDDAPKVVNAVIEIPAGGVNKYEYDKKLDIFRLDRTLHSPVHYPGDYGFIPRTLSQDGDPLDVLVLVDASTFTGCLMEVRPIGLLEMVDAGVKDEKILGVTSSDPRYKDVNNYDEIYSHMLLEISHFFGTYKDLEGKRAIMKGWHDFRTAHAVIMESHERYNDAAAKAQKA
ncbi:MAG: Inorganic pyrophosphatase [Acidobacteriales bacterium]|nr:Inorganic pyrophosphatase [Terriglobales bacterium]